MPRTICIVQARMTSSRLPGKVLMDLCGQTVLWHVLTRCAAIPGVDTVVCAVPDDPRSAPIVEEALRCGAAVFRGSEEDVLDRYHRAAAEAEADVVVRVTSDCPLIDPGVCGELLALHRETGADFSTNNLPPTWPHGLDAEVFTYEALERSAREARDCGSREHVSDWLRRHPAILRANLLCPDGDLSRHRWTLDYPEDLDFFRALFPLLRGEGAMPHWRAVLAVVRRHPEVARINARATKGTATDGAAASHASDGGTS